MAETQLRAPTVTTLRQGAEGWRGPVIDSDVHVVVPALEALYPYIDEVWIEVARERGWHGPTNERPYPTGSLAYTRSEWRPADGRPPASSLELVRPQLLDVIEPEYAILNCTYPVDSGNPDMSVALARAVNDWIRAEWLDQDPRLRASILLPTSADPRAMVDEIERVATDTRFVQTLLPVRSGMLYGKRLYWPVFEAITRAGLVAGIHWGGTNHGIAPRQSGWPSRYIEEYAGEIGVYEAQLISLIAEGTFQHCPTLRVTMMDIGFTWVPMWMWDMDRNWRAMRREVPWITRYPFEIVRDHIRFTSAPLDVDSPEELAELMSWLGSEEMVLFATDYPHTHDDDLGALLSPMTDSVRKSVMAGNARRWYGLQ
jgi:uncharacterized protein